MRFFVAVILIFVSGCFGPDNPKFATTHRIRLYSGGVMVREWKGSDVYRNVPGGTLQFTDEETGKRFSISGTITNEVEQE